MIQLKILSDPICPWCYIGKTGLDKVINRFSSETLNLVWMPFQLNPAMPKEGMDRKKYLINKFGSTEKTVKVYAPIIELFRSYKVACDLSKIKRTPNTLDAQRLIYWAGIEGCQTKIVDELFKGFFSNGIDIGDRKVLIKLGKLSGLSEKLIRNLLESEADKETLFNIERKYREAGVTGVPTCIINDDFVIPGAQTEEFWIKVLSEILEQH